MNHLDLFSGIGGFALAASWVWKEDHNIISFCEIDPFCQKVLKKHWPDTPCHNDINTLKVKNFEKIDLLTGGFPCQPFSNAGNRRGSADDRHLWPEMFKIIQKAKPTWIIGENVAGLVNMVEFEQCLLDLEDEEYETQPIIIPASGVNARHHRKRVWILAYSDSNRQQKRINDSTNGKKAGYGIKQGCKVNGISTEEIYPNTECPPSPQQREAGRMGSGKEYFPWDGAWEMPVESLVCGKDNGIPARLHRCRALGNSIVPQCVVPIMQAIKEIELI